MTPLKSIKEHCLWCCNGQRKEVTLCPAKRCPLFQYRKGKMPKIQKPSPLKAIRARCLDCVGLSPSEVQNCAYSTCALYVFRFGHNPRFSEVTKAKQREHLLSVLAKNRLLRAGFSRDRLEDDEEVALHGPSTMVSG